MTTEDGRAWLRRGAVIVAVKLLVLTVAVGALWRSPSLFDVRTYAAVYRGNYGVPPPGPPSLGTALAAWDAAHYLSIARHGYTAGGPEAAFYPLWPYVVRAVSALLGGRDLLAALLASNLLSLGALLLFHRWVAEQVDRRTADLALALLVACPSSAFLCFAYSESLFLLLAVAALYLLGRGRLLPAAAVAALMPLCRPVGLFIAVPLLWAAWRRERSPLALRWALAPLAGWAAYFAVMAAALGDPFAGFAIQRQFVAQGTLRALLCPGRFAAAFVHARRWFGPLDGAVDRVAFVWFAAATAGLVARWRAWPWGAWAAWALLMGVLPAVSNGFMSFDRFLIVIAPVFVISAVALARAHAVVRCALIAALFAGQILFAIRYVSWRWVG